MTKLFPNRYYDEHQLRDAGIKAVGKNVRVAADSIVSGLEHISIGDNVRIDAFCTLIAGPAGITMGSHIHIAGYCVLGGGAGIVMEDFSGLSHGVRLYSCSDDYSGRTMTNPMVPEQYKRVARGAVHIGTHAIIGSGSIILPRVQVGEGAAVGALSLLQASVEPWGVYSGCPAVRVRDRSQKLLALADQYEQSLGRDAA